MTPEHQPIPGENWFKSTYSGSQGDCVEVAHVPTHFRKSSYSSGANNCVEVADRPTGAAVRDTQNRELGALAYGPAEWRAFLTATKNDLG